MRRTVTICATAILLGLAELPAWCTESTTSFFHEPFSYVTPGRNIRIKAVITDRNEIQSVHCIVGWDSENTTVPVVMSTETDSRYTFTGLLPPPPEQARIIRYTLRVTTSKGVSESHEYSIQVKDTVIPGWQEEETVGQQKHSAPEAASVAHSPTETAASGQTVLVHTQEPSPPKTSFGGTVETFGASYFRGKPGADNQFGEIRILPRFTYTPTRNLLFHIQGDVRVDSAGQARGAIDGIVDRSGRQRIFDIREGYVEYGESALRVRAGRQIFDWSVTDTVSVADNLNPRDWNDLIRWERVNVPALDVRVGGDSYIQGVYVPWFTPSRLPPDNGRWNPPPQPGVTATVQELPKEGSGQWGMRAGTVLNGFDLAATAYSGYNFSPAGRVAPVSATSAMLTPYYRRMEVYGASVAKEVFGYNLRMESGYFRIHSGDRFVQYIGGIDREWGGVIGQTDSLYLLFQYADETLISRGTQPLLFDFRRVFMKSAMVKLKYSLDDTKEWTLKLEGSYNLRYRDAYIEPSIAWSRFGVTIETGVNIMDGPPGSFWGAYRNNSRVFLKGAYQF